MVLHQALSAALPPEDLQIKERKNDRYDEYDSDNS